MNIALAATALALVLALMAGEPAHAAGADERVLDDFDGPTPVQLLVLAGSGRSGSLSDDEGVVGGRRWAELASAGGPAAGPSVLGVGGGQLALASGVGSDAEVLLAYGEALGLAMVLDLSGHDTLRLSFSGVSGAMRLKLQLVSIWPDTWAGVGNSQITVAPATPGAPLVVDLGFGTGPNLDLAHINAFGLWIDTLDPAVPLAFNLDRLSVVSSVPEPGAWTLLGGGLLVLAAWRRHRPAALRGNG